MQPPPEIPPKAHSFLDLLPPSLRQDMLAPAYLAANFTAKRNNTIRTIARHNDRVSRLRRPEQLEDAVGRKYHHREYQVDDYVARRPSVRRREHETRDIAEAASMGEENATAFKPADMAKAALEEENPAFRDTWKRSVEDFVPLDVYRQYKFVRGSD